MPKNLFSKDYIQSKVTVDIETECWNWNGTYSGKYPREAFNKKQYSITKVVWELWNTPISRFDADGRKPVINQICKNYSCCNPAHLEITNQVNLAKKTSVKDKNLILSRVKILEPDNPDTCWEWQRGFGQDGYGKIKIQQKTLRAHRVAWEIWNGPLLELKQGEFNADTQILEHICNNIKCVAPHHLKLSDMKANVDYMKECERDIYVQGTESRNSKLTEEIVLEIKLKFNSGNYTRKQLAEEYNLPYQYVCAILNGSIWKHVGLDYVPQAPRKVYKNKKEIIDTDVIYIREEFAYGRKTKKQLTVEFEACLRTISSIIHSKTHKHVNTDYLNELIEERCKNYQYGLLTKAHKLTEDQVREIRYKYSTGSTVAALAREYNVAANTIKSIVQNKSWRHVK